MLHFKTCPKRSWFGFWLVFASALGLLALFGWEAELSKLGALRDPHGREKLSFSGVYGFLQGQGKLLTTTRSLPSKGIYRNTERVATSAPHTFARQELKYQASAGSLRSHPTYVFNGFHSRIPIDLSFPEFNRVDFPESIPGVGFGAPGRALDSLQRPGRSFALSLGFKGGESESDTPAGLGPTVSDTIADGEVNPFLDAIRDNFENIVSPVASPDPVSQQRQQQEEVSEIKSPPNPPSAEQDASQLLPIRGESTAPSRSSAYVVVGDFGDRQLQIAGATKSSPYAFNLEGNRGLVHFEGGLDLGPHQAFWLGNAGARQSAGMVVTDGSLNLIDWYSGTGQGQFVFENGFYFSAGSVAGAAASDLNADGATDLIVGSHLLNSDLSNEGFAYLYFQQKGTFVLQRRIFLGFPLGGIHVARSGAHTRILAVDYSLTAGQVVLLDAAGTILSQQSILSPVRRQDVKLTFSSGNIVLVRLAEFSDVTFLGAFEEGQHHLIAAVENGGPLPFLAIGELRQDGQRRCWVHF